MAAAERRFRPGQRVWLRWRVVTFLEYLPAEAAVVRFEGEEKTRAVPAEKLAPTREESLTRSGRGGTR